MGAVAHTPRSSSKGRDDHEHQEEKMGPCGNCPHPIFNALAVEDSASFNFNEIIVSSCFW